MSSNLKPPSSYHLHDPNYFPGFDVSSEPDISLDYEPAPAYLDKKCAFPHSKAEELNAILQGYGLTERFEFLPSFQDGSQHPITFASRHLVTLSAASFFHTHITSHLSSEVMELAATQPQIGNSVCKFLTNAGEVKKIHRFDCSCSLLADFSHNNSCRYRNVKNYLIYDHVGRQSKDNLARFVNIDPGYRLLVLRLSMPNQIGQIHDEVKYSKNFDISSGVTKVEIQLSDHNKSGIKTTTTFVENSMDYLENDFETVEFMVSSQKIFQVGVYDAYLLQAKGRNPNFAISGGYQTIGDVHHGVNPKEVLAPNCDHSIVSSVANWANGRMGRLTPDQLKIAVTSSLVAKHPNLENPSYYVNQALSKASSDIIVAETLLTDSDRASLDIADQIKRGVNYTIFAPSQSVRTAISKLKVYLSLQIYFLTQLIIYKLPLILAFYFVLVWFTYNIMVAMHCKPNHLVFRGILICRPPPNYDSFLTFVTYHLPGFMKLTFAENVFNCFQALIYPAWLGYQLCDYYSFIAWNWFDAQAFDYTWHQFVFGGHRWSPFNTGEPLHIRLMSVHPFIYDCLVAWLLLAFIGFIFAAWKFVRFCSHKTHQISFHFVRDYVTSKYVNGNPHFFLRRGFVLFGHQTPVVQDDFVGDAHVFFSKPSGTFEPLMFRTQTFRQEFDISMVKEGVRIRLPKSDRHKEDEIGFVAVGIQLFPFPQMHSSNATNEAAGLILRHFRPTIAPDAEFLKTSLQSVLDNLPKLLGVVDLHKISTHLSLLAWASKFPLAKIALYLSGFEDSLNATPSHQSSVFVKKELLIKDCQVKPPRIIMGSTSEYNRVVGPEMTMMYIFFKVVWNIYASVFLTGGTETAEMCGARYARCVQAGMRILDGDFKFYDGSQCEEILVFLVHLFKALGISEQAALMMTSKIVKEGFSKNGVRYKARGTRGSGEQDTLLGNSILTAVAMLIGIAYSLNMTIGEYFDSLAEPTNTMATVVATMNHMFDDISAQIQLIEKNDDIPNVLLTETMPFLSDHIIHVPVSTIFRQNNLHWTPSLGILFLDVLGDDNLTAVPGVYANEAYPLKIAQGITKLGMENIIAISEHPSIMSSAYYPVGQTFVLGPRPGRILAKFSCISKPFGKDLTIALGEKAYGLHRDSNFVPILRAVVRRTIELCPNVQGKLHSYKAHASRMLSATDETYQYFYDVYGLTVDRINEIESEIMAVPCLPYRLVFPELQTMYTIDNGLNL